MYNYSDFYAKAVESINTVYLINGLNFEKKQNYSDLAKAFVIKKASEMLNVEPQALTIEKTANGKPYFKDYPDFYFNISHTSGAVAVAFSNSPIGVDIEKSRNVNLRVASRFFNEKEKKYVFSNAHNTNRRFFEIWTKKEAYIKRYGLTLSHIKKTDTSHIHTFQKGEFIISVCSDCDKSVLITLEKD